MRRISVGASHLFSVPDVSPGASPGICFPIIGVQRHSGSWCRRCNNCCLNTNALRHRRTIAFLHGSVCLRFINIVCAHAIHVQKNHLRHLLYVAGGCCIYNTLKHILFSAEDNLYYFFFSSSTVGAESLYLKRLIFCVAVFSKGSFITSTELTCDDLFTFLLVMLRIFAFQWSSFS